MSGIAEVLANSGYSISGSDVRASAVTERLQKLGTTIYLGHNASHVEGAQVVVLSSAINKHNPEIMEAMTRRIPIIHRSEMLAELMRLKYGVIVAGTHGKTTTTSMIAEALQAAGLDPTTIIGGRLNSYGGSNAKMGKSDLFVAEGDESDGSFLRLTPTIAVLTNIDRDHMDHYESFDKIVQAFEAFVDKVPFYGAVCACIDDPAVQLLLPKIRRKLVTFGLRQDADITATDIRFDGLKTHFVPLVQGKRGQAVTLHLPGGYNVLNSLASFAVGSVLGVDLDKISAALTQFQGVEHRYSVLGTQKNVTVVDDYAHNPKKILTVLRGTREAFPNVHICAIFQPHRYSRLKFLGEEFSKCFVDADSVIVTPIYAAGEQPIPGVSSEHIAHQIRLHSFHNSKDTTYVAQSLDDAAQLAVEDVRRKHEGTEGSIVITLGAGDVQQVGSKVLSLLAK
jgi:UDP-N-acetylmuramate--alanine ligase